MKLNAWLRREKVSPTEFGKMIGAKSRGTVPRYLSGMRRLGKKYIKKIKQVTRGEVTADSFQ